ncbi:conserved hypothetical protein [Tiamatvirus PSSP7]|uniref:Uncharacterized protein n=2 Tax=Prochlorococcus phage P-SSP7 TaxID=268748 RepID=Q58N09_BPPRP|nr:uncharacterized protein PSSP7_050 [Prochlorococcus phage P-SSP7]AAX44229.1 uncharacterized protein PSSP7_050 [Prochlorococcus phage P-SSP7]ACY76250.1 conserved hypothetical protein [Tiamatvirus PSSP7]
MSREKQKVYEKIQKGFQEDTIAGAKLRKDVPLLATNLNKAEHLEFLFKEYRKQGLIPKKFKNAEQLKNQLQKQLYAIWNKIAKEDPSVKNDKGFRIAFFNKYRQELLSKMVQKEAISKLTPAQKANPEIMDQISKMRWKGLPIKVNDKGKLSFDRRYFQDKVSQRVIKYANSLEPGLGDKWAKEMRASWNAIGERNRAIKANSGLSFDIGHFIPSKLDGPNVGINAAPEPSAANRSKGSTPFSADRNLARQLGIPESWMQSFTDWHLRQQGMDPNLLPKGYELKGSQVVDAASGISDPNAEIAKNRTQFELDQQEIPEGKLQSDFEIVDGQVIKKVKQTPSQQILGVINKRTNKLNTLSDLLQNPVENYEVNYTPKNGNGNGNGNGVNGKNGNGIAVNGKNGKNGFLKGMENVKNYSGLGKLRDADQLANIGLNVSTGNYVGAGIGATTYGTSKALQNKQVQARVAKQITKLVAERGAKSAAKMIPGLDILLSSKESWDYLKRGRWDQAGIAALSGAIGWIPVVGDGASAALDLSNTGLDIARLQAPTGTKKKKNKNTLTRFFKGLNT